MSWEFSLHKQQQQSHDPTRHQLFILAISALSSMVLSPNGNSCFDHRAIQSANYIHIYHKIYFSHCKWLTLWQTINEITYIVNEVQSHLLIWIMVVIQPTFGTRRNNIDNVFVKSLFAFNLNYLCHLRISYCRALASNHKTSL